MRRDVPDEPPERRCVGGTVTASRQRPRGRGPAHLSYRAGGDLATDLSQVAEVLAWPADLVATSGAPDVLGVVVHRGQAVPVLCLAGVLGRRPDPVIAASRPLLVDVDGVAVAYAVSVLHAILGVAWTDTSAPSEGRGPLSSCPLVQLEGSGTLLPALDLVALARGPHATAPALPGPRTACDGESLARA